MNRVRLPDGTLNHFTAASGVEIYRGDRLPKDMVGDLFFNEPVGRIVRRAKVVVTDGLTQLRNAYPKSEFVRSTDPLFRPVCIINAPDGTLYLMDMYTGIIQDAQFVGPNSYLRRKVEQYDARQAAQLGPHLAHHLRGHGARSAAAADVQRDAGAAGRAPRASERLVARHGAEAARAEAGQVGRAGAEDDGADVGESAGADPRAVDARRARLARRRARPRADEERRIRRSGSRRIRASETLYKAGDKSFAADYKRDAEGPRPNVVIQAMLTMNLQKVPEYGGADSSTTTSTRAACAASRRSATQILKAAALARAAAVARGHRRRRREPDRRAAPGAAARRGHLQGAVLLVPRAGRQGRADAGATDGHDAGAAAGRIAARARASRLRHQGAAARPDRRRSTARPTARRRDGADGHEHRRVDRRRRQLRAQQLRQRRAVRHAGAGRGGSQGVQAPAAVDARRAAADDPDAADQHGGVEAHREPQPGGRGQRDRGDAGRALGYAARRRSRACGSRSSCRSRRACPNW